jgi:hypothetical protein
MEARVAELENLKTVRVPTFYLNTVPVRAPVPALVLGHLHAYPVFIYIYVYIYVYVFVNVYIYIYLRKHILIQYMYMYMYTYIYMYMYTYIYIYTSVKIRICVCIREKEIIKLLINFFEFLLHFLVPGTRTVFRIRFRFRCRSP